MISSAEEFIKLRTSESKEEQDRATHDNAEVKTWNEIINKHPEYKEWVIHNKTIQIEILEQLTLDSDPKVRGAVARKRRINNKIFELLSVDKDENVRCALISNTNLSIEKLKQIEVNDSPWLERKLKEKLNSI
jgi:hypothetical protein